MSAELNEYDALLESNEYDAHIAVEDGRKALRSSMVPAVQSKPDTFAEAKRLGGAIGAPADVVERNLDTVRQQVQINEYDRLLVDSPALAKHLTDQPDFAKIAHDDTENLSMAERVTRSFKRGLTGTLRGTDALELQESAEILSLLDRVQRGELADDAAIEQASPYGRVVAGRDPVALRAHTEQRFTDNAVEFALRSGKIAGLPTSPEYRDMQEAQGWVDTLGFFFRGRDGERHPFDISAEIASESLGALLPSAPLIAAGGVMAGPVGLAATTFGSSAFTEFSNALPGVFAELGVDLTDRAAVQAVVQTPEFKAKARAALVKAGVIGVFDAATAGVGAARLRPSAAGNLAAQAGVQAGGGAAGEVAGSLATGQEINPAAVIAEAIGEVPTAVFDAGVLAVRQQHQKRAQAQAAEQDAATLQELATLTEASKVAQRDPASFQAFVDAAAAEGPVQDVYVPAKLLAETLQQDGLAALAQTAPTAAAQFPEALASGGDVRIPLGEYAVAIAGGNFGEKLLPHLKTDPAGMSQFEAQEYMQGAAAEFKQQSEQILAEKEADDVFTESAAKVEATVFEQLTTAKRFTGDVNKAYATLTRDFYVTTASRLGITPEALYARYPLRVVAESVAGEGLEQPSLDQVRLNQLLYDKSLAKRSGVDVEGTGYDQVNTQIRMLREKIREQATLKQDAAPAGVLGRRVQELRALGDQATPEQRAELDALVERGADLLAPEQLNQGGAPTQPPRGAFSPSTNTIALLKGADLSTFLHESGHFFLEVLADLAAQPESPLAGDMQTTLAWFGVPDLATWQGMTLDQKRPYHEKWARGFEAYLFEGKAPSVELKALFGRFRSWLLNVYRSLAALNVDLTPEVRGVFDRMLASEQQIAEAEAAAGVAPLFTEPTPGMTPDEFTSYQALGAEASAEAVSDLQRRSLRDMQWLTNARGRTLKALQRDAAAKRKAVQQEVEAEVAAMPVYASMRFLKTGELPDGRTLGVHRLQVSAIEEMYPEGRPGYQWRDLGQGSGGMTGVNGITPDAAAELLGFTSGDHLIRDLLAAQPQEVVVEGLTDQRMLERYGDIASPEALARAASEAVHNDARMRFVTSELNALAKATGGRKVLGKAARDFAAAIVARKRVRDLKPAQYTVAEARAARAAQTALKGGNLTEAAVEKRNQLVNGYASRAAHEALDEVDKAVRYLRKVGGPSTLDPEYAEQIHALLGRFDLRRITNREADRRGTLTKWVEAQRELGFEPAIDEALLDEAARKPYRDMAIEEFRGLVDTVRNIEHLGRLKKKLLTAVAERAFDEAVETASASIRAHAKGKKPVKLESNTKLDAAVEGVGEFFAMHRKVASLLREMDGFQDGGVLWELLMRPLNTAANGEAVMREKATMALDKLFTEKVTKGMRQKVRIDEIGASLSKEGRLAVALNWGNLANRQRVTDGDGWNPAQVQAILRTLTADELGFVNQVWEYVDSHWAEIAAKEKRVSGVVPEKVEATPFEVRSADGQVVQMRGGYYPIKYDPKRSSKAEAHNLAEAVKQSMQGLYTRATTRRGHTKARAEEVGGRPVRKDLGVVFEHVTQVAHDLSFHEYLIDANRLLRAGAIDSAIRDHYGPEVLRQLRNALQDIAAGDVPAQGVFERSVSHIRTGATIAGLAWNVTTALIQPLGLTQSMVRIGPKWVGRGLSRWLRNPTTMRDTALWIDARSDFMRLRGKTMQREISEIRNKVSGKDSAIEGSFFYMIQQMQRVVDIPTWLGAYEKAMDADPDEARAIALADQAVLDAQGGGQVKDLAAIQRGGPLLKLWTNFYSFFNVAYNLAAERGKATNFKDPAQVGRLAVDYLLLFTVPAALGAVVRTALKPGADWDDLPERIAREQLNYLFGLMVGLREVGAGINGFAGYSGPAGLRFFAEINKLVREVGQGDWSDAGEKALEVGGLLLHLPVGQIKRTAEGVAAIVEGDTVNPLALVLGPPQ